MLKRRVIIKRTVGDFAEQEGIVVAVRKLNPVMDKGEDIACKILVGENLSNWIPIKFLEIVQAFSTPA